MTDELQRDTAPLSEGETPTMRLRRIRKETAPPTQSPMLDEPITSRLSQVAAAEKSRAERGTPWLWPAVVGGGLLVAGAVAGIFLFTGGGGLQSGEGGIDAYGTDTFQADVLVETLTDYPAPVPAPVATPPPTPAAPAVSAPTIPPPPSPTAPEDRRAAAPAPTPADPGPVAAPPSPAQPVSPAPAPVVVPQPAAAEPVPSPAAIEPAPSPVEPSPTPSRTPAPPAPATPSPAPASGGLAGGFQLGAAQPTVREGDLVPLTADVVRPQVLRRVAVRKPPRAAQLRRSGVVVLQVLIDHNGDVIDTRVRSEDPPDLGFGDAAIEAVKRYKYEPARKDNVRVQVWDTLRFTFR